jgi:integrase
MKSNDKKISISIRKNKNGEVIQLRRLPITKKDRKISTGDEPTYANIQKYIDGGLEEWKRLANPVKDVTFAEFAKEALKEFNEHVCKDTLRDREKHLKEFINPTFGDILLSDVSHTMVNPWQKRIKAQKGADYARRVKELFSRIIKHAVLHGHLAIDITLGSSVITGDSSKPREIYSKYEVNEMIEKSEGWLHVFIIVRAYLWLRSAEAVGLKWSDIDFVRETIHIKRGIRWGKFVDVKGGDRVIDIPPTALKALKEHKKQSTSDWVFATKRFNSYWSDCANINRRHFQPFLKKIGIRYKSFYSLRSTGATLALAKSSDWTGTMVMLGHKKLSTTTDYYIKPVQAQKSANNAEEAYK